MALMPYPKHTPEKIWAKVDKRGPDECWLWRGTIRRPFGYGATSYQGRQWIAHRLTWFLTHGPIPADLQVLHRCDVPACVNPNHLFLGTQADNMADMCAKGRAYDRRGHLNSNVKLTADDVRRIRQMLAAGDRAMEIAERFNVTYGAIYGIKNGTRWKHLGD